MVELKAEDQLSDQKTCPTCSAACELDAMFCPSCGTNVLHVLQDIAGGASEGSMQAANAIALEEPESLDARDLPLDFKVTPEMLRDGGAYMGRGVEAFAFYPLAQIESHYRRLHGRPLLKGDSSSARSQSSHGNENGSELGVAQVIGAVIDGLLSGGALSGDIAYAGANVLEHAVLSMSQDRVYEVTGAASGTLRYKVIGNELRESDFLGKTLAHLRGNQVLLGSSMFGEVIATINRTQVHAGRSSWGNLIASVPSGNQSLAMAAAYHLRNQAD